MARTRDIQSRVYKYFRMALGLRPEPPTCPDSLQASCVVGGFVFSIFILFFGVANYEVNA